MCGGPHDLSVMADFAIIVDFFVAVFEIFIFHVPHSDSEIPENERTID